MDCRTSASVFQKPVNAGLGLHRFFPLFVLFFLVIAAIHPTASAKSDRILPPDPVVLEEFSDLEKFIVDLGSTGRK